MLHEGGEVKSAFRFKRVEIVNNTLIVAGRIKKTHLKFPKHFLEGVANIVVKLQTPIPPPCLAPRPAATLWGAVALLKDRN